MSVTTYPDEVEVVPGRTPTTKRTTRHQPLYNVVLLNDDDHSFEYVVLMLKELFGHSEELGGRMAMKVHLEGRCVVKTTTKEHAELKQEQIHAYGPDKTIPRCEGSMSAEIEPAE